MLEKVVLQDNLSTLVVKLYPRNEGYSLMLKDKNGAGIHEIIKQSYSGFHTNFQGRVSIQGSTLRPIQSHLRLNFTNLRLEKRE